MMDCIFGLHPDGMVALGPPERFIVKADWKSGAENFCGDAYHVGHHALFGDAFRPDPRRCARDWRERTWLSVRERPQLHRPRVVRLVRSALRLLGLSGSEMQQQFDLSRFDAQQIEMMTKVPPTIGTIFPNFSYLRFPQPARPNEFPMAFTNIRMWQPKAPGVMELWVWEFEYKCAPEQYKRDSYLAGQFGFGAGGIFEQDDTVVWEGIAKAGASPWLRREQAQLHYQQIRPEPDPDWKGPGQHFKSIYGEYCQEAFWRRWLSDMREGTAK